MSSQPLMTGACCPKSDNSVTQLRLGEGHSVGLMGLNSMFEQLRAMDRNPEEVTDEELLGMIRAQKNYITPRPAIEATYAAALRREYATFCAQRVKR